jgi:tRNA A-37 threonylcarbamoyl transferase component Bud32
MIGEVLAGRYELQEVVGSGGMSSVFRSYDRDLQRTVALKVLHHRFTDEDEYVERFRREARMAAGLSHPNIVTVIDRGDHGDRPFIVFEYVDGENLKELVQRTGPLSVEHALELGIQIARGLSFAHQNGLVHRDVKPQNVLLNGSGQAKVTDFGIARSLSVERGVTQTGAVLGTADYISPEQAQGGKVDECSDVYSLGVVLYELLSAALPFSGDNFVAVAMQHVNQPAPAVSARRPDVPPRLEAAIGRALAKAPRDRFAMDDLCRELETCLEEVRARGTGAQTVMLQPSAAPSRLSRAGRPKRRVGAPIVLIVIGLAVAAVVSAVLLIDRSGDPEGQAGIGTRTAIALQGVGAWDPFGGDGEHDGEATLAADGDPGTYWQTSSYNDAPELGKDGVGVLLDAGKVVEPEEITVVTDTPGFTASIQAGDSAGGPFKGVSESKTVQTSTTYELEDARGRYFVVWITRLPDTGDQAYVNEVRAR